MITITTQKVNKFVNLDSRFRGNDIRRNGNDRYVEGHSSSCHYNLIITNKLKIINYEIKIYLRIIFKKEGIIL